jgi:PAS domain S-box-containing protein
MAANGVETRQGREGAERARLEQALRECEERYHGLFDRVPVGLLRSTPEGRILDANPAFLNMLGYPDVGSLRRVSTVDLYVNPEDRKRFREKIDCEGVVRDFEAEWRRRDGATIWARMSVRAIKDDAGRVVLYEGVEQDVTERRRAEAEIRRAHRALRALSECGQVLVRASDPSELLQEVCRLVVEIGGYRQAWVGRAEDDADKTVRIVADAGVDEEFVRSLALTWADTERGRGPTGTAIRTGQQCVVRDIARDPSFEPWRAEAMKRGHASTLSVPLVVEGRIFGALTITANERDAFDGEEVKLLTELAADTAYGLESLRLRAEHRKTQEALEASERTFRALTEHALDVVTVLDSHGVIRYESPAVERMVGYRPEELVGTHAVDYVHPADAPAVLKELSAGIATPGATARVEFRFRHKDGSWRVFESVGRNLLADPSVAGIIVNSRDITDRRLAEQALRESSRRITSILESITDGFFTLDARERFTYVNRKAEQLLRKNREELLGRGIWEVYADAVGSAFSVEFRRAMAEQVAVSFEEFYPPLDMWLEVRAYPSPDGLSVYFRDATDRRRADERLRQAEKLTTLGELISGVAHELNNPLTVVTGFARILEGAADVPERVKRRLGQIDAQAQRAAKIVKNLLTFARRQPPQWSRVRLGDLVDQALDLLAYALRVNNVAVTKDFAADAPEITADPDQLLQVILNIVQNAMQAMAGAERRRVSIRIAPFNAHVRLAFEDTGPGIPRHALERVFDPFFTTKPPGQGTGLGLSICYGIVKAHGGEIFAENPPGGGARFVIELPVGTPVETGAEAPGAGAPSASRPGPACILAVDDEPEILSLVAELLGAAGHRVQTVVSARTALTRIEAGEPYDAVILDVKMPDMDGRAIYEELARRFPEVAARVIFATGDVISGDTRAFLEGSGRPSLMKPFSAEELGRALALVLTAPRG